jgi:hypothetical protein
MRVHSLLCGLVVVGHDGQDGVGADGLRIPAQIDRLAGRIGASARDDRYPALRGVDGNGDDAVVLRPTQIGRFAGGPAYDQGTGTLLDLTVAEVFERRDVDPSRFVERRRQGRRVAR